MASLKVKCGVFAACLALFVMAVAAHEGHEHQHGAPEPGPPQNRSSLAYPSMVLGVFTLLVSSLVAFTHRV